MDINSHDVKAVVRNELSNGLLRKLFLLLNCIFTSKVQLHEETSNDGKNFESVHHSIRKLHPF